MLAARLALAVLVALAAAPPARATIIETLGLGARASALGGAYTGVADTPAAIYYNPAGLTQLLGDGRTTDQVVGARVIFPEIELGQRFPSARAVPRGTTPATSRFDLTLIQPDFRGGFELTERLYLSPFALTTAWAGYQRYREDVGDQRFSLYEAGQVMIHYTPRIAVQITDWLSIGGGPDVQAFHEIKRSSRLGDGYLVSSAARSLKIEPEQLGGLLGLIGVEPDGQDDGKIYLTTDDEFPTGVRPFNDLDSNWRDVGFTVGVHLRPTEWLRLGVTYRSEIVVHAEGTARFILFGDPVQRLLEALGASPLGVPLGLDEFGEDVVPFRLDFVLPAQLALGAAVQVTDVWLLSADVVWTDWSARDRDVMRFGLDGLGPPSFDFDDDPSTPDTGIVRNVVVRGLEDTWSVRVGSEVAVAEPWRLRVGYWWDPSPASDAYWTPELGINDRHVLSGGVAAVGLWDGWLDAAVTVQAIVFDERDIAIGESRNLGGTVVSVHPEEQGFARNEDFDLQADGHVLTAHFELTFHWGSGEGGGWFGD